MIHRIVSHFKRAHRSLNKHELLAKFTKCDKPPCGANPGLVIIQIDGLSRMQMEKALKRGKLPFLRKLLESQGYSLHSHYSGLPSSTPSVQGELLYGVEAVVPSFGFKDPVTGKQTTMSDTKTALAIETVLEKNNQALLEGGSSYSNIFTGGASRAGFCMTSLGLKGISLKSNLLYVCAFLFFNTFTILRIIALVFIELGVALSDLFRGVIEKENLFEEARLVLSRIVLCILLRELITTACMVDILHGRKIIHVNFIGYDEQAHRRGPSSAYAHWTLIGIDHCIHRIWHAIASVQKHDYDLWIYSDHGQEETVSYDRKFGIPVEQAVLKVLQAAGFTDVYLSGTRQSIQSKRTVLLGSFLKKKQTEPGIPRRNYEIVMAGVGPLEHLYLPQKPDRSKVKEIGEALVRHAHIPLVMTKAGDGTVWAWTKDGFFILPDHIEAVIGSRHPFCNEIKNDLPTLVHHPYAGDFILSGWSLNEKPITFPKDNGSHCGPGLEETHGFALLPSDIPYRFNGDIVPYLRPTDIREAAFSFTKVKPVRETRRRKRPPHLEDAGGYRIITYNIHSCIDFTADHVPDRIARILSFYNPDIVALQEVDAGRRRSDFIHQAAHIAGYLDMEYHFHPCCMSGDSQYGIAVLSRLPMRVIKADILPSTTGQREPRGAIWAEVRDDEKCFHIVNTHLGLTAPERRLQIDTLMGNRWLADPRCKTPVVFCGDFNAFPKSRLWHTVAGPLHDAANKLQVSRHCKTWMGLFQLDYIFTSPDIHVRRVFTPATQMIRTASDHRPLIADISW